MYVATLPSLSGVSDLSAVPQLSTKILTHKIWLLSCKLLLTMLSFVTQVTFVSKKVLKMAERVLLTGISGYIGQHCGAELLNQGFEVVGTVRSLAKAEATKTAIAAAAPVENLSFVEADLLADDGWDTAMEGCTFVMHVASPFVLSEPKDENDLITPAVEGTRRVVEAAMRAQIRRVVLTSSIFAMIAGKESGRYGTDSWSDITANIGAYSMSKTLAERVAWEIVDGSSMELTVINPGAVYGPSLGAQVDGQAVTLIKDIIGGKMPMIPNIAMGMVDVRDVARLHVAALTATGAAGHRFIAATSEPIEMVQVAEILRNAGYSRVPSLKAPDMVLKAMSLFDRQIKGMLPYLGRKIAFDTRSTVDTLGWQQTHMSVSLTEMAAAF